MAKKVQKRSGKKAPKQATHTAIARKAAASRTGSLRKASAGELQEELQRRSRDLAALESRRDALLSQVESLDAEIAAINSALGVGAMGRPTNSGSATRVLQGAGGRRPRNESSLEVALAETLKGKTMGVSEVAEAVQKAGYQTTSPNFRTIVNQTLLKSSLIKKIARGQYTAK